MPRATAEAAAATARDIVSAAQKLFCDNGFTGVTLDDVAAAAGVTRGAVYHHYRNKQGLFDAVAEELQRQVGEAVASAADSAGPDPRASLRAGCHAFLDTITAAPAARVLLIDAPSVIGWARWRSMDVENSAAHLREALHTVGTPDRSLDAVTVQLSGAMNEAALWLAQLPDDDPSTVDARSASHGVLDQLLDALT